MRIPYDYRDRFADIRVDFEARVREKLESIGATGIDIHLGYDAFEVECLIEGKSFSIRRVTNGMGAEYDVCNRILAAVDALVVERPTSSLRHPAGVGA